MCDIVRWRTRAGAISSITPYVNCSRSSCTTLTCHYDGSQFDVMTGAVLRGPASAPLATYDPREQDGEIQVRV